MIIGDNWPRTLLSDAHLYFNGTKFKSNTAVYHAGVGAGGAIRSSRSSITCVECIFEENEAYWGGGVIMSQGTHQFTSTTFKSNGAALAHEGRDVYLSNPSSANFHACTFQSTGDSQMFIQASTRDIVTFSGQTVMPTSIKENDALYTNLDAPSPPPPPSPPPLVTSPPPPPWPPGTTSWTSYATYARGKSIILLIFIFSSITLVVIVPRSHMYTLDIAGIASNGGFGAHGIAVGHSFSAIAVGGITGSTTFGSTILSSVG